MRLQDKAHLNLSTDRALSIARDFLKAMAQPRVQSEDLGITMLNEQQVTQRVQQLRRQRQIEEEQNGGTAPMAVERSPAAASAAPTPLSTKTSHRRM